MTSYSSPHEQTLATDFTIGMTNYVLARLQDWNPADRPLHCSNCLFAKVGNTPDNPLVTCMRGHGRPIPLIRVIARKNPVCFRPAATCPDFESMDD